ncbi:MAG TPA: response regulator [Thermodesulfobacteriota bacterium]|nr:response regulator [Thermodesulfobacteriota bacterium]
MRKRILVVEDEPDIATLLKVLFVAAGLIVVTAGDLASARAALAEPPPPDLVVLDLVLPDGDGLELCREVRAAHPSLPVVVLTAQAGVRERAVAAGATLVVAKPFDLDRFEADVQRLLRNELRPAG